MATKPTLSFTLATNTNYATGPFAGSATKAAPPVADGFVPGVEIDAEHHNYVGNIAGLWSGWCLAGSYTADLDAHPMETDSTGITAVAGMVLGGTAAAYGPLTITGNTAYATAAATITQNGGGSAIIALADDAAAAVRGICTGSGPGIEGQVSGGTGPGVKGTGNGGSVGGQFIGGVTGAGVTGTGGVTSGNGVEGTCTAGAGYGVLGTASTTASSFGVRGNAAAVDGGGVYGNGFAGASATLLTASAVLGTATNGTAVWGSSTLGYGVVAQGGSASPTRSALRISGQNADPTAASFGDVYTNSVSSKMRVYANGAFRDVHHSTKGFLGGISSSSTGTTNSATLASIASVAIAEPNLPSATGTVIIEANLSVRNAGANLNQVRVELYDLTAAAVVAETEIFLANTLAAITVNSRTNAYERTITFRQPYALPDLLPRTFQLRICKGSAAPATGIDYKLANISVAGVF